MDRGYCYECHWLFRFEDMYVVDVVIPWVILLCEVDAQRSKEIVERVKQEWAKEGFPQFACEKEE